MMNVKNGMLKTIGCVLLALLFAAQAWGQTVTIKGKVVDASDDSGAPGVNCIVVETGKGTLSGEGGAFSLQTARKPEIRLLFKLQEYKDSVYVIKTEPGKDVYEMTFAIQSTEVTLETSVITAGRHAQDVSKVTASMDVMQAGKVDLQATNDVEDALQMGSGVDVIDGQPNIRGSSGYAYGVGSRVMVMLDGLPLLSADASAAQFDLIPTDNIQQIEVMKGASSVLYGSSALGGVINVITADAPDSGKTSIRLRGTMYGPPRDPALDWDGDKNATTGAINIFHSRKIGRHDVTGLVDAWKETGWKHNTEAEQARVQFMTKFRPAAVEGMTWGLNGSVRYDSSRTFVFWDSYYPDDSVYAPFSNVPKPSLGAFSGSGTARNQLNMRYALDPFVKFLTDSGNVHMYRGHIQHQVFTNNSNQSNRSTVAYNDYQYTTAIWDDRVTWVSGATYIYNSARADSLYQGGHFSHNIAAYTQLDGAITSKLNATLGGRYDYIRIDDSFTVASPVFRAGLNYEPTKGTNLRASWGQAFRSPSIAERYTATAAGGLIIIPNPQIEVEKGWTAEVGVRQGFLTGTKKRSVLGYVDVAGFIMDYQNMIEFGVTPPAVFNPFASPEFSARNVADARITGVEATAMVQVTYDKFHFDFNGGITYIDPKNLNPTPDSAQVDFLNTLGTQQDPTPPGSTALSELWGLSREEGAQGYRRDNPPVLKYRSKWTNRASATVGYGRFNLTCNYRYKSNILAIDQFLYVAIPGSADWVRKHDKGFTIVDFILGVNLVPGMQLSLNCENAFNTEWSVLPGIMGEPRNYTAQLKYVF
jgi:iron complex outermembrane receptor protein